MKARINALNDTSKQLQQVYKPVFFRTGKPEDIAEIERLTGSGELVFVHDEIYGQLQELIKMKSPGVKIKDDDYPELISSHLDGRDIQDYGVWVYYPWSRRLVHILDEEPIVTSTK
jgi:hypothetical protein